MKIIDKYGIMQVLASFCILWIAKILQLITKNFSKDVFLISFMISLLVITDAKMKYSNNLIKISYWIIFTLFVLYFVVILI